MPPQKMFRSLVAAQASPVSPLLGAVVGGPKVDFISKDITKLYYTYGRIVFGKFKTAQDYMHTLKIKL